MVVVVRNRGKNHSLYTKDMTAQANESVAGQIKPCMDSGNGRSHPRHGWQAMAGRVVREHPVIGLGRCLLTKPNN